jgi:hypothetical protein
MGWGLLVSFIFLVLGLIEVWRIVGVDVDVVCMLTGITFSYCRGEFCVCAA